MDAFGIMLTIGMLLSVVGYIVYKIGIDDKYSRHADTMMRRDII